jgi:hypothetical protein
MGIEGGSARGTYRKAPLSTIRDQTCPEGGEAFTDLISAAGIRVFDDRMTTRPTIGAPSSG